MCFQRKCEQYWPDTVNEEKLYGDIKVRLLDVGQTADFYMRTFDITRVSALAPLTLTVVELNLKKMSK